MNRALVSPGYCNSSRVVALLALAFVSACQPHGGSTNAFPSGALPAESLLGSLPLGEIAGADIMDVGSGIENPVAGNAVAIAEGHRLYVAMNCAGCHGYGAGGAMGPNLTDPLWRYGGTPAAIYNSILEGRPQGMPAWGRSLPAQEIWKITAYLQTLGGGVAAADYHAGLQGDHHVTSVAREAHDFDGALHAPPARAE